MHELEKVKMQEYNKNLIYITQVKFISWHKSISNF